MLTKLLVTLVGFFGASFVAPAASAPFFPCTTLCKMSEGSTHSTDNGYGGTMTVTYVGVRHGTCRCEGGTMPCLGVTPTCAGSIRFSFDDDVSWEAWVPHVTNNGTAVPVCAAPPLGSNQPPDHDVDMSGCGSTLVLYIEYWKKRLDNTVQEDINPDLLENLSCAACSKATNCQ